jgi:hypothetical protein
MAWRIHEHVMRAVIDNRTRGAVTGVVWLAGRPEPLRLELQGNAWSDLAGCLIRIENPSFCAGSLEGLATEQRGVCGDLTAIRRGKMPATPPEAWFRAHPRVPVPQVWGTGIYAEWFSERNGRVVIELMGCSTCVSERAWHPTTDEQSEPAWCNLEAVDAFLRSRLSAESSSRLDSRVMRGGSR